MSFIYFVGEKQEAILESFGGAYERTVKEPGVHFKWPWPIQSVAEKISTAIRQEEKVLESKTKDDIFVKLPIKMHLSIVDSKKFYYDSENPTEQVESRIVAAVKQLTSQMEFAELYQARETISDQVREKVGAEIESIYGMTIKDVIIDEPIAPPEIQQSYNNVKASQRNRLAAENDAQADKIKIIAKAEAHMEAQILDGKGISGKRREIFNNYAGQLKELEAQGINPEQAHQTVMLAMTYDTLRDIGEKGNTIVTTTNASDILSQFQAMSQQMKKSTVGLPANDTGTAAVKVEGPKATNGGI